MIYFGALGADTIDYGNKTDADIDALRTQGKYRIFAYQGTYWPVNTYGVLYVEVANNYTIQYFIKMAEGVTYKRTMVTNAATPTWSGWVMDYSTDILTKPTYLAPLASALGVKFIFGSIPESRFIRADGDCLDINDGGLWQITGGTSIDDGPAHSPKKNEYFYVFAYGTSGVMILLAVQTRGSYVYIGVKRDGDIIWKQIMVTT